MFSKRTDARVFHGFLFGFVVVVRQVDREKKEEGSLGVGRRKRLVFVQDQIGSIVLAFLAPTPFDEGLNSYTGFA